MLLFQFCQLFVHPCQLFNSVRYIMEEEIVSQNSHQHQDRYGQYHPPLMVIIKKYTDESNGYLFPILNVKVHKTALQKQNRIHKIRGKVNDILRTLGKRLGIEANITTYVARHSFASVLKKSGGKHCIDK